MNKEKKLLIVAIVAIIATIGLIIYIIVDRNKDKDQEQVIDNLNVTSSEDIFKDAEVSGLKITHGYIATRDEISTYSAIVTNETSSNIHIEALYVVFTIDDEEVKSLALQNENLKPDEEKVIMISFDRDMANISKIDYVLE